MISSYLASNLACHFTVQYSINHSMFQAILPLSRTMSLNDIFIFILSLLSTELKKLKTMRKKLKAKLAVAKEVAGKILFLLITKLSKHIT